MKSFSLLSLAALSAAFVVPNEQVHNLQHVEVQRHQRPLDSVLDKLPSKTDLLDSIEDVFDRVSNRIDVLEDESKRRLDEILNQAQDFAGKANDRISDAYFDIEAWLDSEKDVDSDVKTFFDEDLPHDEPPHRGDGKPHPPHEKPPHRGPGHHKSNLTLYQLIASSKYTTKLAKLVSEYDDLVEMLNSTTNCSHFTVFAPTDKAFEKIPEDAPKPPKEFVKALLSYHISPAFYPAGRVLVTRTIPTLLMSDSLGDRPLPQRLSTNIGLRGLTVNFYSRVVAVDIFGSNGVIHAVDSLILPPPSVVQIIDLLPGEFSTLELGLAKTGLLDTLNTTDHEGGTLFAPSNFAFQKLGPKINAFLFSKFGLKYLTALLKYHVVPGQTLYSDAYYKPSSTDEVMTEFNDMDKPHGKPPGPPKGRFHVDLPTFLEGRTLAVDIARYGRLIEIKLNTFSRVAVSDGVAKDGVIHVVSSVLIPPKQLGSADYGVADGEMSLEEFKERLEPLVEHDGLYWGDL